MADALEKVEIDPATLTLRELREVEKVTGLKTAEIFASMGAEAMAGLAYVVKRRTNPDVTFDECLDLPAMAFDLVTEDRESGKDVNGSS